MLFQVKANCTASQLCSNMSCNVSSIAQSCLHLASPASEVDEIWDPDTDQHQDRENRDLIPLWLGEILSNGHPDESILATLQRIVQDNGFVQCTIPEEGSGTLIECRDYFPL